MATQPRRAPRSPHRESWEDDYGMELDSVTRYRAGTPPTQSVADGRAVMNARLMNGRTPTVPLRLQGTRLSVNGRILVLLTLARTAGGYRMVAVDPVSRVQRELWCTGKLSRAKASERHFSTVEQLCAKGAVIVSGDVPRNATRKVRDFPVDDPQDPVWATLATRLEADSRVSGPVGDVARWVAYMLEAGDLPAVVIEAFDASRTPFQPLADAASQWLILLGYDRVRTLLPSGAANQS